MFHMNIFHVNIFNLFLLCFINSNQGSKSYSVGFGTIWHALFHTAQSLQCLEQPQDRHQWINADVALTLDTNGPTNKKCSLKVKWLKQQNMPKWSRADSKSKTADSETNIHADSETKIRKLKPQIRKLKPQIQKLSFGNQDSETNRRGFGN